MRRNPCPMRLTACLKTKPPGKRPGGPASAEERRGSKCFGRNSLSSVAVELGAVGFQPFARAVDRAREFLADLPEARPVIHLFQMRDLVRHHVIEHVLGREDQAPGEGELALIGARTPAALGVADRDLLDLLADRFGLLAGAGLDLALGLALQPLMDPAGQMLLIAGHMDLALFAPDDAPCRGAVTDAMRLAEEGHDGAVGERNRLRQLIETLGDPVLVA